MSLKQTRTGHSPLRISPETGQVLQPLDTTLDLARILLMNDVCVVCNVRACVRVCVRAFIESSEWGPATPFGRVVVLPGHVVVFRTSSNVCSLNAAYVIESILPSRLSTSLYNTGIISASNVSCS